MDRMEYCRSRRIAFCYYSAHIIMNNDVFDLGKNGPSHRQALANTIALRYDPLVSR